MKNKHISIKLLLVFLQLFCIVPFSSCSQPESEITLTAFIIGKHSNSKNFDIQIEEKLRDIYSSYGNVCFVSVDGNPDILRNKENKVVGEYEDDLKELRQDETFWQNKYLNPRINEVLTEAQKISADDSEVDTLEAINLAVKQLNNMESHSKTNTKKEIIIYDTGLCTKGALSFLSGDMYDLLNNNVRVAVEDERLVNIIKTLSSNDAVPDLSDFDISWYGIGEVAEPQTALSHLVESNLQRIWGEILKHNGAKPLNSNGADKEYGYFYAANGFGTVRNEKSVTPIFFPEPTQTNENSTIAQMNDSTEFVEVKFTEKIIHFKPNEAILKSDDDAKEILKPYAKKLNENNGMEVLLVGSTSSYRGGSIPLSEDRANKIRGLLVELGVSSDRIKTVGVGYDSVICVNDTPKGIFDESIAQENRAVTLLSLNTKKAKEILENPKYIIK